MEKEKHAQRHHAQTQSVISYQEPNHVVTHDLTTAGVPGECCVPNQRWLVACHLRSLRSPGAQGVSDFAERTQAGAEGHTQLSPRQLPRGSGDGFYTRERMPFMVHMATAALSRGQPRPCGHGQNQVPGGQSQVPGEAVEPVPPIPVSSGAVARRPLPSYQSSPMPRAPGVTSGGLTTAHLWEGTGDRGCGGEGREGSLCTDPRPPQGTVVPTTAQACQDAQRRLGQQG